MSLGDHMLRQIGAAIVIWDHDGTPVELTPSWGGVRILCEGLTKQNVSQDGYGTAAIDMITAGIQNPYIEFSMSDMDLTRLGKVIGFTIDTNAGILKTSNGVSLRSLAKKVLVKPLIDKVASTTESEWVEGYKVTPPQPNFSLEYKDDNDQRVLVCRMDMLPSDETGLERAFGSLGTNIVI